MSYVDEHRNVFRMVFSSKVSGELRAKFEKMLEGLLKKIESEKTGQSMDDAQLSYRTCYRAQGCVAVLSRWLEGGTEPKELISKVLAELDLSVRKIGG
ncbi:MAG: TetR family transcriptional regulator C-terminal domain-containing protein [Clostridiales bacterium]|nr:TetR family transcriptional regulator C-terminal domain-containing protein [Clostridiales bacterium]